MGGEQDWEDYLQCILRIKYQKYEKALECICAFIPVFVILKS